MQSYDLSHFLKILPLGLGLLLSLGTRFPCRDYGPPVVKMFFLGVPHLSLSPEDLIFQGHPPYLSSG
jgi:hypothetical protein